MVRFLTVLMTALLWSSAAAWCEQEYPWQKAASEPAGGGVPSSQLNELDQYNQSNVGSRNGIETQRTLFFHNAGVLAEDINGNGFVDIGDVRAAADNFGGSGIGDVNHDGQVDIVDLVSIAVKIQEPFYSPIPALSFTEEEVEEGIEKAIDVTLNMPVDIVGFEINLDFDPALAVTVEVSGPDIPGFEIDPINLNDPGHARFSMTSLTDTYTGSFTVSIRFRGTSAGTLDFDANFVAIDAEGNELSDNRPEREVRQYAPLPPREGTPIPGIGTWTQGNTVQVSIRYADYNTDGTVNVLDVFKARKIAARIDTPTSYELMVFDTNGDNVVNVIDILGIRKRAARFPDTFPIEDGRVKRPPEAVILQRPEAVIADRSAFLKLTPTANNWVIKILKDGAEWRGGELRQQGSDLALYLDLMPDGNYTVTIKMIDEFGRMTQTDITFTVAAAE